MAKTSTFNRQTRLHFQKGKSNDIALSYSKKVCEQAKIWHDKGYNLKAGINISAKQFNQDKLVEIIQNTINETSIKPNLIELELTESIIMKNVNRTLKICKELKKMGVSISLKNQKKYLQN